MYLLNNISAKFSNQFGHFIDIGLNVKNLLIIAISTVVLLFIVKLSFNYWQARRVDEIIDSYRSKKNDSNKASSQEIEEMPKKKSPFVKRERKSGLTWGGGNMKGANPIRGTKKEFLK